MDTNENTALAEIREDFKLQGSEIVSAENGDKTSPLYSTRN